MKPLLYEIEVDGKFLSVTQETVVNTLNAYREYLKTWRDMDDNSRMKLLARDHRAVETILKQKKFIEEYSWIEHD